MPLLLYKIAFFLRKGLFYYTKLPFFSEKVFNRHVALSTFKTKKVQKETLYKNKGRLPND